MSNIDKSTTIPVGDNQPDAAFITLNVDPVDNSGLVRPRFHLRKDDEGHVTHPKLLLGDNNLLDFSRWYGWVYVRLKLKGQDWQWDEFLPGIFLQFSYLVNGNESYVDPLKHGQIVRVDFDPKKANLIGFLYGNRKEDKDNPRVIYEQSSWGYKIRDSSRSYTFDPIISNGGNPSLDTGLEGPP